MKALLTPLLWLAAMLPIAPHASPATCRSGAVYEDVDRDGRRDPGEAGIAGIRVSDGRDIVVTDDSGAFRFAPAAGAGTIFVIKPAGYRFSQRSDGLPAFWRNVPGVAMPALKYGGMVEQACDDVALQPERFPPRRGTEGLRAVLFSDPQAKSMVDVGYYERDIVASVARDAATPMHGFRLAFAGASADLGLSLGDIVDDDLSLYPAMNRATASLGVPWLHVAGNHDLDFDAGRDEDSLLSFRNSFGPDTYAWEEPEANFVLLDDVVYRPGQVPAYVGGLREDQFAFLEHYLATADRKRLLVLGLHIPLFESAERDTFRDEDRERLFALLLPFPRVLLLSGHSHGQRHVLHGAASGWQGAQPLHEYNVGAASGAYWSGAKDAAGIPDSTMADGTPNGYALLAITAAGDYALAWHPARGQDGDAIGLHAPRVLRRGAYPAWGVFANVYMGRDDTRVEYRIDGGEWKPMKRVLQPDPRLLAENARDDEAGRLRGYDRSPEAEASPHLWRGALRTDLATGQHRVEVRAFDAWRGELRASTAYRLEDATP